MKTVTLLLLIAWLVGVALAPFLMDIHGISRSSIHLPTTFDQSPIGVTWKRVTSEGEMRIAKIQNGSMTESLDDRYSLGDNGIDVWIHNVTEDDNGQYIAEATMAGSRIEKATIYLTVHDPVPDPKIHRKMSRTGDRCYITLNCSDPSQTDSFSLVWKYRHNNSEYQTMTNAGSKIEQILPLDHQDIEFVCIVQNPVDQKNNSVLIKQCSDEEKVKTRSLIPIAVSFVIVAVFGVMLWKSAKKSGQVEVGNENLTSPVQDSESQESPFISIPLGKTRVLGQICSCLPSFVAQQKTCV